MNTYNSGSVEGVKEHIKATKLYNKEFKKNKRVPPKSFPENVTLTDLIGSLPQEVFTQDRFKAFSSLFSSVLGIVSSLYLLANSPWYLWPIGWLLGGASIAGLFMIGHDCVHRSFAKSRLANDIIGTLVMLPVGYAYESWKTFHKYQNNMEPISNTVMDSLWKWAKGYNWWVASLCHWGQHHFDIKIFKPEDRLRVRLSIYVVYAFAAVFFPAMFWTVGVIGIFKYWVLPILAFHVLLSTTTMLPLVVLDRKDSKFIVHCEYPKWLEFLSNDINIQLPHNIATGIPHYNLRLAYESLKKNWGDYIYEVTVDWELLEDLVNTAHTFDSNNFVPFPHHPLVPDVNKLFNSLPKQPKIGFIGFLKEVIAFTKMINWLHVFILIPPPFIGLYGWFTVTPDFKTVVFAFLYYWCTGLGITAGYHRLWAHKSYNARLPLKLALLFFGSGAVEGSVRWWARDHRAHHRYTDTEQDPYSAPKGFLYSHVGWMLVKQEPGKIGRASIEDLNADPWIRWQHRNYLLLATLFGAVIPTAIPGLLWGDWAGGYFYATIIRLVFVHHATFLVNSLAHFWGDNPFADNHTPRDSVLTAVLTFGEGYHNFHHEFPHDYRNAIKFYQYDPTKWLILACKYLGLATDLKSFPHNEVTKGQIQMKQRVLDKQKKNVFWGVPPEELPLITRDLAAELEKDGFKLIVIRGFVHDVTDFIVDHPGGRAIIEPYVGKDASKAFTGGVYLHSNGANNLLTTMRVGRIDGAFWDAAEDKKTA